MNSLLALQNTLPEASRFLGLLARVPDLEALRRGGAATLLVPHNRVFVGQDVEAWDSEQVVLFIHNHLLSGRFLAQDLVRETAVATAAGTELLVTTTDQLRIGNACLLDVNAEADDIVIHVIDRLLVRPACRASAQIAATSSTNPSPPKRVRIIGTQHEAQQYIVSTPFITRDVSMLWYPDWQEIPHGVSQSELKTNLRWVEAW
jgi:hypothetical protein